MTEKINTQTGEIIEVEATPVAKTDRLDVVTKDELNQRLEVYDTVRVAAIERMKEGVDFGVIPGTNKPTLLKPGAEKLCNFFGYSVETVTDTSEIDPERNYAYFHCVTRLCRQATGQFVASGVGSVNSREKKYKKQLMKVDADIYDLLNTLEKMASKRSLIDAVLRATGLSDIYTQDLEDLPASAISKPKEGPYADPEDLGVINFGKYKGDKWTDLPSEYLTWIAEKSDLNEQTKVRASKALEHKNAEEADEDEKAPAEDEAQESSDLMHPKQVEHLDTLFAKNYDSDFWNDFKKTFSNQLTIALYERWVDLLEGKTDISPADFQKYFDEEVSRIANG